jgi:uncharacterized lipoprotein YddW (UPF0748 family)
LGQGLEERPIRGAWYRPSPSPLALDGIIDLCAQGGITDLYVESFYHGLATHDSSVFNDRYAFDLLGDILDRATKRGVRVHAWLEAAYWSFGGLGNYILDQHPDWKVVDDEGNTNIGDQAGQVFVNIGHPGVQQKLADLCTELAANYPMMWGIQTDYHRFPLDNDLGDNQLAPYSFDQWSRDTFQSAFGVDPLISARLPGQPFYNQFVNWRRQTLAEASRVMNDAIVAVDPGKQYSGAVFATAIADQFGNPNNGQLVKMQDWPRMAQNGWLPIVVPMAYGSSVGSIRADLRAAKNQANGSRIVAGYAIINPQNRPGVGPQLDLLYSEGLDSFIFFEANALLLDAARRAELSTFLATRGPFQTADLNEDGRIDSIDWDTFYAIYTGTPMPMNGPLDLNGDNVLNATDDAIFRRQFRAWRFGADGQVGVDEYQAVLDAFTDPGEVWPGHLYDLTGDGVVDCADVTRLRRLVTVPVPYTMNPDVNGDTALTETDVRIFVSLASAGAASTDLDGNGLVDVFDTLLFIRAFNNGCP